jgi:hypothetical protein
MRTIRFRCLSIRTVLLQGCLVLCLLTLTGCLDYEEEMWLNNDLSGEVAMTISLSDRLSDPRLGADEGLNEDLVRKDVEAADGLKLKSFESFKENGKQVTRVRIAFSSVEKLAWLGRDSSGPGSIIGKITVSKEDGHHVMKRSLEGMSAASPQQSANEALVARGLASLLMGGSYLVYTVHFPNEVLNANSTQIAKENNTVRWKFPLSQAMSESITMRAEWKSGGWLWWAVGGILVLALVIVGALQLRKRG